MLDASFPGLSVKRQTDLLQVCRSSFYYRAVRDRPEDLSIMREIDRQYLKTPFYGSRRMRIHLRRAGYPANRRHVQRLMRLMGIEAIYQKPRTTVPNTDHKVHPYLLHGLVIDHPNHVWCSDITYVAMRSGFLYLVAVMDWYSRKVLSWRLSNTLEADFCISALEEALGRFGVPTIFNTDQGCQFTSLAFTGVLEGAGVQISMDGRGRFMDNIFVERLWRSLKYEEVYLKAYESGSEARREIGRWMAFYNSERPHAKLRYRTPDETYEKPENGGLGGIKQERARA